MNKRVTDLIEAARKLTPEEREELLLRLQIEFEDGEPDGMPEAIEAAWAEEAERRIAKAERGETTFVDLDDVLAKARKLIPRS